MFKVTLTVVCTNWLTLLGHDPEMPTALGAWAATCRQPPQCVMLVQPLYQAWKRCCCCVMAKARTDRQSWLTAGDATGTHRLLRRWWVQGCKAACIKLCADITVRQ